MFTISFEQGKRVVAQMDALPERVHSSLSTTIRRLAKRMLSKVQRDKLQGQVLNHRTGKLSRSIEQMVTDEPESIVGRVFANGTAPYAAIHEFGFSGSEHVKAHSRTISMVFGRPISPMVVQVSAFDRQMNMPERSFLRSTLDENAAMIEREMTDAIARAAQARGA